MNREDLINLINTFRAERTPFSISPDRLGSILLKILEVCNFNIDDLREFFIAKDRSDRTPYDLSVGGHLTAEDLLSSKEFLADLFAGFGWGIDSLGNAELETLKVRSGMWITDLICNRILAVEGNQLLTEGDTIERAVLNSDGTYTLYLQAKWDGYFTAQIEHNVLWGIYNDIENLVSGPGTSQSNNATFYSSWLNVLSVDTANNTIRVAVYDDKDVPAGKNYPPCAMMKVARFGNSGSSDNPIYKERQQCLYLSSTEGRFLKLFNVTKPIIDRGNVAVCIGTVPDFLVGINADVKAGDQIFYADKALVSQFINVDYQGRPVAINVDRGIWAEDELYYAGDTCKDIITGEDRYYQGGLLYERSRVLRWGCSWLCNTTGSKAAPEFNTAAWTLETGISVMRLEFDSTDFSVWVDNPSLFISLSCFISTCDLSDSPSLRWDWSRRSVRGGSEDAVSDAAWSEAHRNIGKSLTLLQDDMNYAFGVAPDELYFTVTATLLDPEGMPVAVDGQILQQSIEIKI